MWRSHPWVSHPMLYGCGCGVIDNFNRLTTSTVMRFFWLPLSTTKCSGVPFTHICKWNESSPSSGFSGSTGWIWAVATVAFGYASMICLPLPATVSESVSRPNSKDFISATNDCFVWHSSVLCQGILWISHHFSVSFFTFQLPFFICGLDGLFEG